MSTNQFRRYLDLLNEADLVPPNTNVALPSSGTFSNDDAIANLNRQMSGGTVPRCAVCGTPQSQHQTLKHQFVAGGAADRPDPVPQPQAAEGGNVGRIRQLQAELKAAGANLGATGPNRDGIDGDIGPLTRAAMTQYPNVAAKYKDLGVEQVITPAGKSDNTEKLNSALTAIEGILAKYKVKLSEGHKSSTPAGQMTQHLVEYSNKKQPQRQPQSQPASAPAPATGQGAFSNIASTLRSAQPPETTSTGGTVTQTPSGQVHKTSPTNPNLSPQQVAQAAGTAAAQDLGPMSKLWAGAKGLAKKAALPLAAVYAIWEGYKQISALPTDMPQDQYRAAVTKIVARLVNDYGLFWVGSLLGAGLAGAVSGPGALVGFVAGGAGGIAASYFLGDSVGAITDKIVDQLYGTGGSSISADDQAIIQKNMAIIQDFVKTNPGAITPALQTRIDAVSDAIRKGVPKVDSIRQPSTPTTAPSDINATLDKLDKLLKKNSFESRQPRTLSEQLARDRDIVNEAGAGSVAKTAGQWAWNAVEPIARRTVQAAALGGLGGMSIGAWKAWEYMHAPKTMSAQDQAEFNSLLADYRKMVPDQAAVEALPPDVQKKLIDIANRVQKMEQQGNK